MSESVNVVEIYEWYRNQLNNIRERIEQEGNDDILGKLGDAEDNLRAAFLEEMLPDMINMEEGWRYPPAILSADLAQKENGPNEESVSC